MPSPYESKYSAFRNVATDYVSREPNGNHRPNSYRLPPSGNLSNGQTLQLYRETVLPCYATQLPALEAVTDFLNDHIIYGKDPHRPGTNNFMIAIKNIALDPNNVDPASQITLLDWTVSRATQLTDVIFEMPNSSTDHKGLTTQYNAPEAGNSNVIVNDLTFNGGAIGMDVSGQQWLFK
ncbi:MAG: hypothetical protein M1813_009365 [Trichoglossum hirsutum]|nr:MAG: hypothetical protein M1813_009365 [Trichoglossum hirsutum]